MSIVLLNNSSLYPNIAVYGDFTDAKLMPPSTPTWTDITDKVRQLTVKPTYRQNALDRYEAGTLSMVLDNNGREFDPTYSSSPYYPYVRPMTRFKVEVQWGSPIALTYDLITVYMDGAPQEWPSFGTDALVRVTGTDLFKVLNLCDLAQDGTTSLYGVHGSLGFSGIGTSDTQFWLRSWPTEWPDPANLPNPFYVLIDSEWIKITSTGGGVPSGNTPPTHTPAVRDDSPVYVTAVRAQAGTSAGSHVFGAGVQQAGLPAELSGARVTDVFGAVKLGSLLASAETGISTIVKVSPGSSLDGVMALDHLQDVIDTENGILYVNGSGSAVFQDRHHRVFNETSSLHTFGDGAGELGYEDVTAPYDDERLWNKAKVTASDGSSTVKTWLNDASIGRNGQRIIERTLLISDTNEAENAAQYLTYKYGDPDLRFDQIVCQGASDPTNLWPALLGLTISNRVTVKRRPKVGPAISRDCYLEAMPQHDITPDSWKTTLTLSDASKETFWVLDDAVRGVLDSTTIPGY